MSKAVRRVVGVVAAIAIPFAAPAIAKAVGLSTAIGATAGSALVGAGLGAASSAITGGGVGRGALMGAIGGGIGGYTSAPTQAPIAAPSPYTVDYSLAAGSAPSLTGAPPAGMPPVDYSLAAGVPSPATSGLGLRFPNPGFSDAAVAQSLAAGMPPVDYSLAAGVPSPAEGFRGGTQVTTGAGTFSPRVSAGVTAAGSGPPAAAPTTLFEALKAKMTPVAQADMLLRAASALTGSAVAGDGLSTEERALLDAQTEELRQLQQTNRALFEQRLEQAQNVLGESRYFDPEYFGLQRARRAQLAGAKAKRAGLRGLTRDARELESRRFDLATARDVGTAFDQGYDTGAGRRLQTMQAGMQMMPKEFPSSMADYTNLRSAYGAAALRARQTQRDISDLFGSFTGRTQSQNRGSDARLTTD